MTADREKVEQCFVSGRKDSVNGTPGFQGWGRSWARRAFIENVVRGIKPMPIEENAPSNFNRNDTSCRLLSATPIRIVRFSRAVGCDYSANSRDAENEACDGISP